MAQEQVSVYNGRKYVGTFPKEQADRMQVSPIYKALRFIEDAPAKATPIPKGVAPAQKGEKQSNEQDTTEPSPTDGADSGRAGKKAKG